MAERRQSTRQKSFLRGCIYFNNRRTVIDCLIRDLSDHGARLRFSDSISIPDSFELHIPQKDQTLRVVARWRHGMDVGVAFADAARAPATPAAPGTSATPAAPDLGALSERVQKLEAEVADMRRLLRRLRAEVAKPDTDAA
jgi:PilZ domain